MEDSHEKISVDITPDEDVKREVPNHVETIGDEESEKSLSLHKLRDSSSDEESV